MRLSRTDRLVLVSNLPNRVKGSFLDMRICKDLSENTGLDQEELVAVALKENNNGGLTGDKKALALEKDLTFTEPELEYIKGFLEKLSKGGDLDPQLYDLYEKFIG